MSLKWFNVGKKILVVDDEMGIRNLVRAVLQEEGFDVEVAGGGREAVAAAAEHHPDLVILDVMMPDFAGDEVVHEMDTRAELQETPVVLMSAAATRPPEIDTTRELVFLPKPFEIDDLIDTVHELLS